MGVLLRIDQQEITSKRVLEARERARKAVLGYQAKTGQKINPGGSEAYTEQGDGQDQVKGGPQIDSKRLSDLPPYPAMSDSQKPLRSNPDDSIPVTVDSIRVRKDQELVDHNHLINSSTTRAKMYKLIEKGIEPPFFSKLKSRVKDIFNKDNKKKNPYKL